MAWARRRSGVTLIDLMIALVIMAVVLSAVYSVFAFQEKAVRAAAESRDVYGQGLVVLDRICRDLSGAWLPASASRDNARVQYRFEGEKESLNFTSTASLSPDQDSGSEIAEIGYRLEEDPDSKEKKYILYRRQDDSPDDEPDEGGSEFRMTSDLISFELSYRDRDNEESESTAAVKKDLLPLAVQVKLELSTVEGQKETFQTMVFLPLSQPVVTPVEVPELGGLKP
ncbi:MAG: type II secretion system protein GspJ [Pseudomonadota bacterium]